MKKFEMNDRCAAGTGKFLEIMARTLGFELEEFGSEALKAKQDLHINSMCTVFAESEVTSLVARGQDRRAIALGLHQKRGPSGCGHDQAGLFRGSNRVCRRGGQKPLHAPIAWKKR